MRYAVYLGTYTQTLPFVAGRGRGIYHLVIDPANGACTPLRLAARLTNPSFLALAPDSLYAVSETGTFKGQPGGSLAAFAIQPDDSLLRLNQRSVGGAHPCYVSLVSQGRMSAPTHALVANYSGGNVACLPIRADKSLGMRCGLYSHQALWDSENVASRNAERQEAPHAHSIAPDPSGNWALAADLGLDQLVVYRLSTKEGQPPLTPSGLTIPLHPGAGPRHFAFHPNGSWLYVLNELDSTVSAFQIEPAEFQFTPLQTISTLPTGFSDSGLYPSNTGAHIAVHPSGQALYASNRGHDSLATYQIQPDGRLVPTGNCPSGGRTPRHFALTPDGNWLLAANQDSHNLAVFSLDSQTCLPISTGQRFTIPSPVCVVIKDIIETPAADTSAAEELPFP